MPSTAIEDAEHEAGSGEVESKEEEKRLSESEKDSGKKNDPGQDDKGEAKGNISSKNENKLLPLPKGRLPKLEELLKAGVHFGHQKSRWDPRAGSYIFGERSGIHIINLKITYQKLETALEKIKSVVNGKGTILFLGTKKQIYALVKEAAEITGMPYVTGRWLGGTFTNFTTLRRRIQKLLDLEKKDEGGELSHYTKKERADFKKLIQDFEKNMGGIKSLKDLPDAVFVVGVKEENTAVAEARKTGVPIIALTDTNNNPKEIDFPIPANDDAVKSVQLILRYVAREILEAKKA
ncbi:MAG: 30S ribosomal protein S2 [Candidatus Moranbacteria bacterium]|nr:30S ribosomal protein S2 [Candidatus Moranbacteria bacterium]